METLTFTEYQVLVEQAPILIWRAGLDAKCDYFNQRWLDFTGRTLEQEQGDGWVEGVHAEDLQHCVSHYLANFHARTAFEMDYRLRRHDGEYRWIFDRGVPFRGAGGEFAGYIGSCIDITDSKSAEEELKISRERELSRLRGLLPICSNCKKIRDGRGYWEKVEKYISEHASVEFTHGFCPECLDRLYPDDV